MQEKKAISLIVLVITIIVMIILAGTMIAVLTGENSIIAQARKAKEESDMKQLRESAELIKSDLMTAYYAGDRSKYDQEELLKDLNKGIEGSIFNYDRVTTEDGLYDIIVDDKMNITVIKSESTSGIRITSTVDESGETPVINLRFRVSGFMSLDEYMVNYVDEVIYPNMTEAQVEAEFVKIAKEQEDTDLVIDDAMRAEIMEFGKEMGAQTYLESAKCMLWYYSMMSQSSDIVILLGLMGKIEYPYMCNVYEITEYSSTNDLEAQLLEIAKFDGTIEEYFIDMGDTKEDFVNAVTGSEITYEDILKFLIIDELEESEEGKEKIEKYDITVNCSNGDSFIVNATVGYYTYAITEDGVYTFEAEMKDGKNGKVTFVVNEFNVTNTNDPNGWEVAWEYKNGVWSDVIQKGNTLTGDIVAKLYSTGKTVKPETEVELLEALIQFMGLTLNEGPAYELVIEGTGEMPIVYNSSKYGENGEIIEEAAAYAWQETSIRGAAIAHDNSEEFCGLTYAQYITDVKVCEGITSVSSDAFTIFTSLKNVKLASSVKTLGSNAFYTCENLLDIRLPQDMTTIESGILDGCSKLQKIHIPETVTIIGAAAFSGCKTLTDISIPSGVTEIGDGAFGGCEGLTYIYIPNSVTVLGEGVLKGCKNISSVSFNPQITELPASSFKDCAKLESIYLSSAITMIHSSAFSGCASLSGISLPSNITYIGAYAFTDCKLIQSINLPGTLTSLGDNAFSGCTSLSSVSFSEGVDKLDGGYAMFKDCTSLVSITLPSQLKYIDGDAFAGCTALTSVTSNSTNRLTFADSAFENCTAPITLYVKNNTVKDSLATSIANSITTVNVVVK